MMPKFATIDGNEAVARIAYRLNEVIAIYPITPSSSMGEWADTWCAGGNPNLWGTVPSVVEMQSEGGAAAAVHGALQTGSLTTTFTSSQGLLLMIPNLYKIAGELTSAVIHVAARSLATHALSIFGDQSDVMAARATGFALLCSASVQEAHDFALIAQAATLKARVPFLHFFDGFRTSHEIQKVELLQDEDLEALIDDELIFAHRNRALTPDNPVLRGTAQNPDVYFQARERINPYYDACSGIVQQVMDQFGKRTGRYYRIFEYYGVPDAEQLIVLMGSGCETVHETIDYLNARGKKLGVVKVRLFRPFDAELFVKALPSTVKSIAVLDRTKEPGSVGEPLYLDVVTAIYQAWDKESFPKIVNGRYGLSSKEFTPAMVRAIYDNLTQQKPQNNFTVGINDDLTHRSLTYDASFSTEPDNVVRAMFYGLGADGTVGANKNSIKIIGEETDNYAQGYFVYDSKKSGSMTVSHLRFGSQLIRSTYLIDKANFIGCHQWTFLERVDVLKSAVSTGTFLLNSPYGVDTVWQHLPAKVQQQIIDKQLKFYVIDANKVARESGMNGRINTIMQTCFFALAGVLPQDEAIEKIKYAIKKTYGKKGDQVVGMNLQAVDNTLENLHKVEINKSDVVQCRDVAMLRLPESALQKMMTGRGDELPVSVFTADGTFPTGTSKLEKRNVAQEIPVWEADICVQCAKCVMVCPHAAIRAKIYQESELSNAPATFKFIDAKDKAFAGEKFTIQVAPSDCTGCTICVDICPAKDKNNSQRKAINMKPQLPLRKQETENWDYFLDLPNPDRKKLKLNQIRQQQLQEPLFEFSGACAGCGETPYLKLLSQLFGDRAIIANATGCSSIFGGNLPTTPWTKNAEGRGPAWSNSLFEDNAEFGFGFCLSVDKKAEYAAELLGELVSQGLISRGLAESILNASQKTEADIWEQRERVGLLKERLEELINRSEKCGLGVSPSGATFQERDAEGAEKRGNEGFGSNNLKSKIQNLKLLADYLVKKSIWIVGGDGWAYDIDFGGLDHVLASGRNLNVLVMDTEVYSNTGGQSSKSTPKAAVAKFAASGKSAAKKDLGLMAMTYGNIYVASVALGARDEHTLKAFLEAEAYEGPSLIIAYSHCIAHGIDMGTAMSNQKALVESGRWLLYRYNPDLVKQGKNPLQLDMLQPKNSPEASMYKENRFKMLKKSKPEIAKQLMEEAETEVNQRWKMYEYLAARKVEKEE
ncbi:MAG: pyruvate:ferredoxin (flavodoxin) oxidoreductase [Richelia sp. RM2_1_2]|nr:pyruvate:ferredoxin (flavodoxin) oxidoreductase [Richelia sp. RM1_1_1]NJO61977.1 pyruvate:ferredoxin (flavodoxin) oxidoreductase [Richelia sp. RM2_1_2]